MLGLLTDPQMVEGVTQSIRNLFLWGGSLEQVAWVLATQRHEKLSFNN